MPISTITTGQIFMYPDTTGIVHFAQLDYTDDAGQIANFCILNSIKRDGIGYELDWHYVDDNGDGVISQDEMDHIIGTLNGEDFYDLQIFDDGQFAFQMLMEIPSYTYSLDGGDIKAGGPDSTWIDVGILDDDAFVQIIGLDGGNPAAINESNGFVGVTNGNLDAGEAIRFHVVSDDPDSSVLGDETLVEVTTLSIGTKTPKDTVYDVKAYRDGVEVFTLTDVVVGKNGTLVVEDGGVPFDEVEITLVEGNAVKLGLADISFEVSPDLVLDFKFGAYDDHGDAVAEPEWAWFKIDGNGDGLITNNFADENNDAGFLWLADDFGTTAHSQQALDADSDFFIV